GGAGLGRRVENVNEVGLELVDGTASIAVLLEPTEIVREDDVGARIYIEVLAIVVNVINRIGHVDPAGDHLLPQLARPHHARVALPRTRADKNVVHGKIAGT